MQSNLSDVGQIGFRVRYALDFLWVFSNALVVSANQILNMMLKRY